MHNAATATPAAGQSGGVSCKVAPRRSATIALAVYAAARASERAPSRPDNPIIWSYLALCAGDRGHPTAVASYRWAYASLRPKRRRRLSRTRGARWVDRAPAIVAEAQRPKLGEEESEWHWLEPGTYVSRRRAVRAL
jgi:hypothetical protein